jgi:hypothetical protein
MFSAQRRHIELPRGKHELTLSRNGYEVERHGAALEFGKTREVAVDLRPTAQRKAAIAMFIASGGAMISGASMTGLAIDSENEARMIEQQRQSGTITAQQLRDSDDAKRERDRWRGFAITSFAIAVGAAATGLF